MFKYYLLFVFLSAAVSPFSLLRAQETAQQLINDLQAIHNNIKKQPCNGGQSISNRAMNLFLSDKIGSYLTDHKSLSFYKNYITLNAAEGIFSLNHNLFQAKGTDEPVRSFYVVGVKSNAANAIVSAASKKTFKNELGITLKKIWVSKPKTIVNNCFEKNIMDINRGSWLLTIEKEIKAQEAEFLGSLALVKQENIPDTDFIKAKEELLKNFYAGLREEFSKKFALLQYQELATSVRYKSVTAHWTNFSAYLPVILKRFTVAESIAFASQNKKAYSFDLSLSHTRFWETKRSGRFFLNLEASIFANNAAEDHSLESINYEQYKNAGGADTLSLRQRKVNTIFIGNYKTFLTPAVKVNVVYYPPDSHIGISTTLKQNIGTYNALNWTLGIPVVLINKDGAPSANFEFQIRYFDISHVIFANRTFRDNISISLTVGVPFSKIIY